MAALLTTSSHTHAFIPSYSHVSTGYTFESLHEKLQKIQARSKRNLKHVCAETCSETLATVASNAAFLKSELTITATTTNNTKLITWGEQRFEKQ